MDCYGVENAPQGQSWLCDVCALGETLRRKRQHFEGAYDARDA